MQTKLNDMPLGNGLLCVISCAGVTIFSPSRIFNRPFFSIFPSHWLTEKGWHFWGRSEGWTANQFEPRVWKRLGERWILVGCAHNCKRKRLFNCCFDRKSRNKSQLVFLALIGWESQICVPAGVKSDRVDVAMGCGKSSGESPVRTHSWPRLWHFKRQQHFNATLARKANKRYQNHFPRL